MERDENGFRFFENCSNKMKSTVSGNGIIRNRRERNLSYGIILGLLSTFSEAFDITGKNGETSTHSIHNKQLNNRVGKLNNHSRCTI